jgi:glycosyltransferase involved in cell wall biosynthesis
MSASKLKIAYVMARGDAFGGASLHVSDLARRLTDDGHVVRIFVGGTQDMEVPRRLAAKDLDFQCIPEMGRAISPGRELKALRALRSKIRQFSPHLVSTHASKAGVLGRLACAGMGLPVIYSPHCWSFAEGFPNASVYLWVERCLAPLATRIITVCEQERQFGLSRGVGTSAKTICIHNGVTEIYGNSNGHDDRAADHAPRILMVARFEEQKDQELLLLSLGDNRDLDWHLTLVGNGPRKEACEEVARNCGIASRVEFAGYSDSVEAYLERADLFTLITHWEGFPRSILEAMRAGLPVIVSDVGGCSEAVSDGATGRVVRHGDRKHLTGTLRELLRDREQRLEMGIHARKMYAEKFTFEIMYEKYLDVYRTLCNS